MKDLDCETVPPLDLIYIEHRTVDDAAVSIQENLGRASSHGLSPGSKMVQVLMSIAARHEASTAEDSDSDSPLRCPIRRALTLALTLRR